MQIIRHFLIITVFLLCFSLASIAQDTQRWGDINPEVFQNENITDDPDARAVILFDKGEVYYNIDGNFVFNRHMRIKILDPDNSDYTDLSIRHSRRGLSSMRAQTLNLRPNGEVVSSQLRSSDFIESELPGNMRETAFTFQQLEPGSVVEVEYTLSEGGYHFIAPWYFQHSEPILYSELTRYTPEVLRFIQLTRAGGTQGRSLVRTENVGHYPANSNLFGDILPVYGGNIERLSARNLPAVRAESYISTVNNYRAQALFQVYEYYNPETRRAEKALEDWQTWTANLSRHNDLGRQIERTNRSIRNKVEELTDGLRSEQEKAEAIYDYIVSSVVWDGRRGIYSSNGIRDTFSENTGSGPDITLLYLAMLNEVGIMSYPVILSTRSSGVINQDYPIMAQYNHMVAYAIIDGFEYLIEPLSPHLPFGTLHPESLNGHGKLVERRNPGWIELDPVMNESTRSLARVEIDESGNLAGTLQLRQSGYEALGTRVALVERGMSTTDYLLNDVLRSLSGAEIVNYSIRNLDDNKSPIDTEVEIFRPEHAMIAGDMMYIDPFIINKRDTNPFTQATREAPVEFNFASEEQFNLNLSIPEGYEIEDVPESLVLSYSDNISYQQMIQPMGNSIQINVSMNIGDLYIPVSEYASLQEFFSEIVAMQSSQIVLRKTSDDGTGPDADTDQQ